MRLFRRVRSWTNPAPFEVYHNFIIGFNITSNNWVHLKISLQISCSTLLKLLSFVLFLRSPLSSQHCQATISWDNVLMLWVKKKKKKVEKLLLVSISRRYLRPHSGQGKCVWLLKILGDSLTKVKNSEFKANSDPRKVQVWYSGENIKWLLIFQKL